MISSNHSNLETLKASFVFLLALTLSLISAPIWINVSFIKTSCTSYIIWNLISYSLATANSMVIMMRLKIVQRLLRKCKTKIITKSISSPRNEHKYNGHLSKRACSALATLTLVGCCYFQFNTTLTLLSSNANENICTEEVYFTTIAIAIFNSISLVLSIITLFFYCTKSSTWSDS